MFDNSSTVRLHARHLLPLFTLPAAAFAALDAATREARVVSFAVSPCGEEESTVLAVWLDAALHDDGTEADRTELLQGSPDFFVEHGDDLITWIHDSGGFQVEGGRKLTPVPSEN